VDEPERRALISELAEAVSTQARVANRAWIALITVALFAVLPREGSAGGNVSLPWSIGEVNQTWFHAVVFLILVVLTIYFAAAHAQQIRAQRLAQSVVDSLADHARADIVHPRELFDMLRTPSLNRIAPLAQLLRGKYQFYAAAAECPAWLRALSVVYFALVKLVSFVVFLCTPAWALWRAYALVSLGGWWRIATMIAGAVAGLTLLQVLMTDAAYGVEIVGHLFSKPDSARSGSVPERSQLMSSPSGGTPSGGSIATPLRVADSSPTNPLLL
jgi:hypothetical protein